ncbi:MAG: 7-cyano-7-deazaguanine synthase [Phycisphaerales bacterium JB063]
MSTTPHVMILNNGGLRSLVAAALAQGGEPAPRVTLLHIDDGREARSTRVACVRRQAKSLGVTRVTELSIPHLYGHGYGRLPDGGPMGVLAQPQLLLAALAEARHQQAGTVVWPISVNGQTKSAAQATEQAMLCEHLAQAEQEPAPRIDTPLVEFTDAQVIELGGQLEVDWTATWSCNRPGERPCRACAGCRRRHTAFDRAGIVDTLVEQAVAAR